MDQDFHFECRSGSNDNKCGSGSEHCEKSKED